MIKNIASVEQLFFVLTGELQIQLGEQLFLLSTGDALEVHPAAVIKFETPAWSTRRSWSSLRPRLKVIESTWKLSFGGTASSIVAQQGQLVDTRVRQARAASGSGSIRCVHRCVGPGLLRKHGRCLSTGSGSATASCVGFEPGRCRVAAAPN
jgi:hypothetical protein